MKKNGIKGGGVDWPSICEKRESFANISIFFP